MKAIIIAAGRGARLKPLTDSLPKCLLDLGGRTLLGTQLETLRAAGITDISVVKGYLGAKINLPGLKYYANDRYEHNNILNSLFCAEAELNDEAVVAYSDICYGQSVLDGLLRSPHDISIVADMDWRAAYAGRAGHPPAEAEKVRVAPGGKVAEIGKHIPDADLACGEFPGLMKLSKKGSAVVKDVFHSSKNNFWGKPFHEAATFEKAYLTDLLQELADRRIDVHCVRVKGGWQEMDTLQDYERIKKGFSAK